MIRYTPSRPENSGGITGTLGMHAWGPGIVGTELDVLISQGAVVSRAYSVRKLRTAYAGQCCRLRGNGTGSPEADIPFTTAGALDKTAVATLTANGGGTAAYWRTFYDQSGQGVHASQTNTANQVKYGESEFATGGLGGGIQDGCWLDFPWGGNATPFAVWAVCSIKTVTMARYLMGGFSTYGLYISPPNRYLAQNWGTAQMSTAAIKGKWNVLGVCNGASSTLLAAGNQVALGNAGTINISSTWRIGAGSSITIQNWFGDGQAITELIAFTCDPTGLPGWPAFVAATKSYFGTI